MDGLHLCDDFIQIALQCASQSPIHTHSRTDCSSCPSNHLEPFGLKFFAQGHFHVWTGGAKDGTSLPITGLSVLPAESGNAANAEFACHPNCYIATLPMAAKCFCRGAWD